MQDFIFFFFLQVREIVQNVRKIDILITVLSNHSKTKKICNDLSQVIPYVILMDSRNSIRASVNYLRDVKILLVTQKYASQ